MSTLWPDIVRGLQLACLVVWLGPVLDKAPSFWRVLINTTEKWEKWDPAWAAFWLLALTQVGFSVRWLIFPHDLGPQDVAELEFWAICYLSSACTAIGMIWTQGLRAGPRRNRQALLAHVGVIVASVAGAMVI